MKIVLINTDPMVAKLVEATAKKTGISLTSYANTDEVDSGVLTQESFVFIDEGAIGSDSGRVKSIAQGFLSCLLYAKTKPIKEFTHVVKKPFLPTEILDILQAELLKLGQDLRNASNITKDQIAESGEVGAGESGEYAKEASTHTDANINPKELNIKDLDLSMLDEAGAGGLAGDLQEGLDLGDDLELDLPENLEGDSSNEIDEKLDKTFTLDSNTAESMEDSGELEAGLIESNANLDSVDLGLDLTLDPGESSAQAETASDNDTKEASAGEIVNFLDESDMEELDFSEIASDETSSDESDEKNSASLDETSIESMADTTAGDETSKTEAAENLNPTITNDNDTEPMDPSAEPTALLDELEELGEADFTADLGEDLDTDLIGDSALDSVDSPQDIEASSPDALGALDEIENSAQTAILPQDEVELVKTLLEDSNEPFDKADEQKAINQESSQEASDDMPSSDVLEELESSADSSDDTSGDIEANVDFLPESSELDSGELETEKRQKETQEALLDSTENEQTTKQHESDIENSDEEGFADISLDDLAQVDPQTHDMDSQADSATKPNTNSTNNEQNDFLQLSEKEICKVLGEEIPEDIAGHGDIAGDMSLESSQDIMKDAPQDTQELLEPESKIAESTDIEESPESTEQEIAKKQGAESNLVANEAMADMQDIEGDFVEDIEIPADDPTESSQNPSTSAMPEEVDSAPAEAQPDQNTGNTKAPTETLDNEVQAESMEDLADLALDKDDLDEDGAENLHTEDMSLESSQDMDLDIGLEADPDPVADESLSAPEAKNISPDPANDLADELSENLGDDLGEFGAGLQAINDLRNEMQTLGDLDPFATNNIMPHASMPSTSGTPTLANRTQEELFSELLANKSAQEIRSLLNGAQISINISFSNKQ